MNTIRRIGAWASRHRVAVASALTVGAVGAVPGVSGADPIASGFTSTSATLVTDLGLGIGLVLALLALGLGIRMLVKWAKTAVAKS